MIRNNQGLSISFLKYEIVIKKNIYMKKVYNFKFGNQIIKNFNNYDLK